MWLRIFDWYFSSKSWVRSPTLSPSRPILSRYAGPIPFRVDPIFDLPLALSDAASSHLWVGRI